MRSVRWLLSCSVGLLLFGLLSGVCVAKPSAHAFGIEPGSFRFGSGSVQAGAHSDWVLSFDFEHEPAVLEPIAGGEKYKSGGETFNDVRTIVNELPAGFDASDTAVPKCSEAELLSISPLSPEGLLPDCPVASQVGQITTEVFETSLLRKVTFPVYSMEVPSFGTTAELGYNVIGLFTLISQAVIRPGDEGLTAVTSNIPKLGEGHNISVRLWGVPASGEHDGERGSVRGSQGERPPVCRSELGGPQEARIPIKPFLSNPTSCTGPFTASVRAESWEEPIESEALWSHASTEAGPVKGCALVPFDPSIEVSPSTKSAESPSGLSVSLVVPQSWENPFTISTANLRDTTVALPEGMTANPSLAAGLGACTQGQYAEETSSSLPGVGCPEQSKIGSIEIETPVLAEKIVGAVYIATPYENVPAFGDPEHPEGSLLALYVVARVPSVGSLSKAPARSSPNRAPGNTARNGVPGHWGSPLKTPPKQPFSSFTLKFRAGAPAPLVSPPLCGEY